VHDVQGAEEKKRIISYHNVSENKRLKILKTLFLGGGGGQLFADLHCSHGF
jgi:hypothetical protein